MITVINRDAQSVKFDLGAKSVIIYGYTDKRSPEDSLLINGGTSRTTRLEDADWDSIKAKYGKNTLLVNNIIFGMTKENDAKAKAKELANDMSHLVLSQLNTDQVAIDTMEEIV
jgi:hypothetical protein